MTLYGNRSLVAVAQLDTKYLEECREAKGCPDPKLNNPVIVASVRRAVGSDRVRVKGERKVDGKSVRIDANVMSVEELLSNIGTFGWPGYDAFLEGVEVYRGRTIFGRRVYEIRPAAKGIRFGGIEVYPR